MPLHEQTVYKQVNKRAVMMMDDLHLKDNQDRYESSNAYATGLREWMMRHTFSKSSSEMCCHGNIKGREREKNQSVKRWFVVQYYIQHLRKVMRKYSYKFNVDGIVHTKKELPCYNLFKQ